MHKAEFISELRRRLKDLPEEDVDRSVEYYCELIADSVEDGSSEEEAVAALGDVEAIARDILAEQPFLRIVKVRMKPKRRIRAWEIVLLALGSPLWIVLLAAALVVLLSVYVVLWSIVISFYAVTVSLAASAPTGLLLAAIYASGGNYGGMLLAIGASLLLAGLAILFLLASNAACHLVLRFSARIPVWIKSLFIRKEDEA